ncbi:MAG: DUF1460 domain-containing protein [Proteobacteria bacterium]|nr:DUF1460 domain-containing protein [Pseudomonadota bacterium]
MKVKTEKEMIALGRWSKSDLEHIMSTASHLSNPGERIGFISQHFLNTPYLESTLTGSIDEQEICVINLCGMDCFTFIDYVEAMRLSGSFDEFKESLKKVRYQSGDVDYRKRNHFFTDWAEFSRANIRDVTGEIGGNRTKKAKKILNTKEDGTCFLQGIIPRERKIAYIPADNMNSSTLAAMRTGDYAGIYSELPGLDVSHAGIIIKADNDEIFLRHASALERYRKVVDQPLKEYMADKAGLIVLRALEPACHIMI